MEDFSKISLNEIKKKLKRKKSIIDFFMEFSNYNLIFLIVRYYYPNFSCYNYNFCLQVLSGKEGK